MRIIVGLTPATSGTAEVCGRRFADLPNPGLEVGVLLDASAQHAGRTGREILTIAQQMMGLPARRVDEMLELVSLTPTEAKRRVRNYSLGMRQRLGIATALLGEPEVLILDEPANGLDPAGIRWMRDLLRDYADRGGTVLLSSHLLHEIEVIADDLVVIGNGRIVAQGTKTDPAALGRHPGPDPRRPPACRRADRCRRGVHVEQRDRRYGRPARRGRARARGSGGPRGRRRAHRAPRRRGRRPRGDVPRAHRRHPTRRSSRMTAIALESVAARPVRTATPAPIPLSRIVSVELRKSFDTRSGFWLLASIGIASVLATAAVVLFAADDELTYSTFTLAIGFPMAVILPMIAILSVTGEWSQRSGLTTFTLVPHRSRIVIAKSIVAVSVAVASMLVAFTIGAVGNVAGSAIAGTNTVWDQDVVTLLDIVLANTLVLLVGFMLGVLIRNSAGAIVAYFVYSFLMPTLTGVLAANQQWFRHLQPWVDPNIVQHALFHGSLTGQQWSQLGVTSVIWLVAPLTVGLATLLRSEIK